jgi:hypothetical protein
VIYLDMTTTVVLTPGCCEDNGHFTTSVAVETSLPVEFRTNDRPDRKGEGASVWGHATWARAVPPAATPA